MSNSSSLKYRARSVLNRTYWMSFCVMIVVGLISGIFSIATSISNYMSPSMTTSDIISLLSLLVIISLVSCVFKIFVINPIEVGTCRFFMLSRFSDADLTDVFCTFKTASYLNIVKTMFLRDLYVFLWSLPSFIPVLFALYTGHYNESTVRLLTYLFSIPSIIVSYRYWMISYNLAQNPAMPVKRAFDISTQTMHGEKFNLFLLRLSFIGWYLLGSFTCGIGLLFVLPYVSAAEAEFYYDMLQNAIGRGIGTKEELCYNPVVEEINKPAFNQPQTEYIITKPCPLCGEKIPNDSKFCNKCGCDINAKEQEDKEALFKKYEQDGIYALFKDKDIAYEAAMYRRIYGKTACLSYIKGKAKELGLEDIEITETDIDNLL